MISAFTRLPVPLPPIPNETLDSYLTRLVRRNHLTGYGSLSTLRGSELRRALHQLTGVSDIGLATALPQVRAAGDHTHWPHLSQAVSARAPTRPGCRLCAATRGAGNGTTVFASHEQVVCQRHRRWVGAADLKCAESRQFSVSVVEEVMRANRKHHQLIQIYGRGPTHMRFHDATAALMYWHDWPIFTRDRGIESRRGKLGILATASTRDPRDTAAWYPNGIAFTALLLDFDRTRKGLSALQARELFGAAIDRFEQVVVEGLRPTGATNPFLSALRSGNDSTTSADHLEVGRPTGVGPQSPAYKYMPEPGTA